MKNELLTACAVLVATGGSPVLAEQGGTGEVNAHRTTAFEHQEGAFLPGAEGEIVLFPGHPELDDRYGEEKIVALAYESLEEAIRRSGHVVSITVEDFSTYYRGDFPKVLVRDVMTLDAPRRLAVRRTEVQGVDGETIGRTYTPGWSEQISVEDLDEVRKFMHHYSGTTVMQALLHPDAAGQLERLVAVTSYRVTVEFEGEKETYRAAVKWIRAPGGGVTFVVEDHVTDGVSRALLESDAVAPLAVLLESGRQRSRNDGEEEQ